MSEVSKFAGGDQAYLRDCQYGDGSKLDARILLHLRYSTSPVSFSDFEANLIEWPDDPAVLECGAGTGRFWNNSHVPRRASLTITDISSQMVADATATAGSAGYENVEGRVCDVQELPFEDGSFDVVVANHMLYHVPDVDRAVSELARVVHSGGVLLASTSGPGHMQEMDEAISEVFGPHPLGLYEVFGIDTGEVRLREQFAAVVWHAFDNDLDVDEIGPAVAYGLSFPPGEFANEEQQRAFEAAIERRFVNGRFRIRTRSGVFVCTQPRNRSSQTPNPTG